MKKLSVIVFAALIACGVISCKPREKCPAYGKATLHHSAKSHS